MTSGQEREESPSPRNMKERTRNEAGGKHPRGTARPAKAQGSQPRPRGATTEESPPVCSQGGKDLVLGSNRTCAKGGAVAITRVGVRTLSAKDKIWPPSGRLRQPRPSRQHCEAQGRRHKQCAPTSPPGLRRVWPPVGAWGTRVTLDGGVPGSEVTKAGSLHDALRATDS